MSRRSKMLAKRCLGQNPDPIDLARRFRQLVPRSTDFAVITRETLTGAGQEILEINRDFIRIFAPPETDDLFVPFTDPVILFIFGIQVRTTQVPVVVATPLPLLPLDTDFPIFDRRIIDRAPRTFSGTIIRIGSNFIELNTSILGIPSIALVPLNRFVSVDCVEEEE